MKMIDAWVEDLRRDESFIVEVSKRSDGELKLKIIDPDQVFLRSPGQR